MQVLVILLSFLSSTLGLLILAAPFLAIGALTVAVHTYAVVATRPRLLFHALIAATIYVVLAGAWAALCARVVQNYFQPPPIQAYASPPLPFSNYLAPMVCILPLLALAISVSVSGASLYADSALSSQRSRLATGVLILAALLLAATAFYPPFVAMMWATG